MTIHDFVLHKLTIDIDIDIDIRSVALFMLRALTAVCGLL